MKIENKEMLLYSMDKAIEEAVIAMRSGNNQEIYYRVGTALHWIVDCFDRVLEVQLDITHDDKRYWMALHAANNALKHRADLIQLNDERAGMNMPMFSFFPAKLHVWASLDEVGIKNEKQKEMYKELFEGKTIGSIFRGCELMVKSYFERCE